VTRDELGHKPTITRRDFLKAGAVLGVTACMPRGQMDLNDLTPETRRIHDMLQKALDRYKDARPAEMSARGKKQF